MLPSISKIRAYVMALALICACACVVALVGCSQVEEISTAVSDAPGPTESVDEFRETAIAFAEGWYGDWSFEDGEMQLASSSPAGRCVGYVEAGTPFDQEMQELSSSREAARCATEIDVTSADGDTIQLEVQYVSTQNSDIDEAMFAELQRHSFIDELIFTFNSNGRITHVDGLD